MHLFLDQKPYIRSALVRILLLILLAFGPAVRADDAQTLRDLQDLMETHWLQQLRAQGLADGFQTNLTAAQVLEKQSQAVTRLVAASKGRQDATFFNGLMKLDATGKASTNWTLVPQLFAEPEKWFARAWPVPMRAFGKINDPKTIEVALGKIHETREFMEPVLGQKVPLKVVFLNPANAGGFWAFLGLGTGVSTLVEPGLVAGNVALVGELIESHTQMRLHSAQLLADNDAEAERRAMEMIRTNAPMAGKAVSALLFLRSAKAMPQPELTKSYLAGVLQAQALRTLDRRSSDCRLALELFDPDVPAEFMLTLRGHLLAASQSSTPHLFVAYLVAMAEEAPQFGRVPRTWQHAKTILNQLAWHVGYSRPDLAAGPLPGGEDKGWAILARLARLSPEELRKLLDPFCRKMLVSTLLDGVIDGLTDKQPLGNEFIDRIALLPTEYGAIDSLEIQCKLGEIFWLAKRRDEAERIFLEMATKVQAGTPTKSGEERIWVSNGYVRLGMASQARELNLQARSMYDNALTVNPDNEIAMYMLGKQMLALGRYTEAVSMLEKALLVERKIANRTHRIAMIEELLQEVRRKSPQPVPGK